MNKQEQKEKEQKQLYRHLIRNNLSFFVKKVFKTLNSNEVYKHNWHIDLICEYLTAVKDGEIVRLNINIPPRTMKSDICSVAFPAWYLGLNPTKKIINCSYTAKLAQKLHNKCRKVVGSGWFKYCFPEFVIDNSKKYTKDTQTEFITSKNGFRIATSTNGSITGEGSNIIICDDIMNPNEAFSEVKRESALNWISQTLFSRLNNPKTGIIINIQQRLHEKDFTGNYCDNNWENLIIPIQFEKPKLYSFGKIKKEVKAGELLHEERIGTEEIAGFFKDLGSYAFAGQYMQNPAPAGGGIFKEKWWNYWTILPKMKFRQIFADTAQKIKQQNDYSVFQCWGISDEGRAYLIDQIRGKWEAHDLIKRGRIFWRKHKYADTGTLRSMIVEDKSSGTGLIQILRNGDKEKDEPRIPVGEFKPGDRDKISRAMSAVPHIECGNVYLPMKAEWLNDFLHEHNLFPNGAHDDQVDTTDSAIDVLLINKTVITRVFGMLN